ncbi:MAG: hypothetical protein F6K62_10245 [Sphaerospermopsis sp. SIO1G2]|nr:hypothetical protein [Sphaerospermopsis sp. SIO1G2]
MTYLEKPIAYGTDYIMKPGMTYRDICIGMRLEESEIEAGILALEVLNGPEELFFIATKEVCSE